MVKERTCVHIFFLLHVSAFGRCLHICCPAADIRRVRLLLNQRYSEGMCISVLVGHITSGDGDDCLVLCLITDKYSQGGCNYSFL